MNKQMICDLRGSFDSPSVCEDSADMQRKAAPEPL